MTFFLSYRKGKKITKKEFFLCLQHSTSRSVLKVLFLPLALNGFMLVASLSLPLIRSFVRSFSNRAHQGDEWTETKTWTRRKVCLMDLCTWKYVWRSLGKETWALHKLFSIAENWGKFLCHVKWELYHSIRVNKSENKAQNSQNLWKCYMIYKQIPKQLNNKIAKKNAKQNCKKLQIINFEEIGMEKSLQQQYGDQKPEETRCLSR